MEKLEKSKEMRQPQFKNLSDIEIKGLYTPIDTAGQPQGTAFKERKGMLVPCGHHQILQRIFSMPGLRLVYLPESAGKLPRKDEYRRKHKSKGRDYRF